MEEIKCGATGCRCEESATVVRAGLPVCGHHSELFDDLTTGVELASLLTDAAAVEWLTTD